MRKGRVILLLEAAIRDQEELMDKCSQEWEKLIDRRNQLKELLAEGAEKVKEYRQQITELEMSAQ